MKHCIMIVTAQHFFCFFFTKYVDMIENFLIPQLDEDDHDRRLHYQQDGAPSHFSLHVRDFLDNRFPGRWIARAGPTACLLYTSRCV